MAEVEVTGGAPAVVSIGIPGPAGKSALAYAVQAGLVPPNTSDEDFATWLQAGRAAALQAAGEASGHRDAADAARAGAVEALEQVIAEVDSLARNTLVNVSRENMRAAMLAAGDGGLKTASFDIVKGMRFRLDSTAGGFMATAPANPDSGDWFELEDVTGSCEANPVTVGRNGQTIDGEPADWLFDVAYAAVRFTHNGSTWIPRRA